MLHQFSLKVEGEVNRAAFAYYQPWKNFTGVKASDHVLVEYLRRQSYADKGQVRESEAFLFRIEKSRGVGKVASLVVAQASHQALNVEVHNLQGLGFPKLGRRLGTEGHNKHIERFTSACAAFTAKRAGKGEATPEKSKLSLELLPLHGSTVRAHWGKASN